MKSTLRVICSAIILLPSTVLTASPTVVTNGNNKGDGSLRAALSSGASDIVIERSVKTITISETLTYTGTGALSIAGNGQTIDATGLTEDILVISKGADLAVSNLSLKGPGGYSYDKQGGGKGIFVDVPDTRSGVVNVVLKNVSISHTGNHGIHVSDCTTGDDCGSGGGGAGDGSKASIKIQLNGVTVSHVGFGKADADGVRIDERDEGDIIFSAENSSFVSVGADGVELDEGGIGNVVIDVRNSTFNENGAFCLGNNPFTVGGPCDDGGSLDVDDGFDIDEAGAGSISGSLQNLNVSNNFDEGLDFDEEDAGGIDLDIITVNANGNEDEGIKLSEENDGSIAVRLKAINVQNNNGKKEDIEIEEADKGNVDVSVNGSTIDELKIKEEGAGKGTVKIRGSTVKEALDLLNVSEI